GGAQPAGRDGRPSRSWLCWFRGPVAAADLRGKGPLAGGGVREPRATPVWGPLPAITRCPPRSSLSGPTQSRIPTPIGPSPERGTRLDFTGAELDEASLNFANLAGAKLRY